jgi:hydrogenase expression/formation protein HypD
VIGSSVCRRGREFAKPVVIAGFEPLDVLQAVGMLIEQINQGRTEVETQFSRAVTHEGNQKARERVAQTMVLRDSFEWRAWARYRTPH